MKLSTIGLFALGLLAAVSAAVMVASLQKKRQAPATPTQAEVEAPAKVRVLVASRDLDSMTVLGADGIEVREVERSSVPEGAFADPVQVVGRVLKAPLKAEQAFLPTQFATDGSSMQLISALKSGMRAVNVQLSDPMGMEELLYPGCSVDVLASLKTKGTDERDEETLSVTLLQGVTVLAVGVKTIVAPGEEAQNDDFVIKQGRRPSVTLLVNPEEAQALKLAMHNGSVSLSMRSPLDESFAPPQGKRLVDLSPILKAREIDARNRALELELEKAREEARQAKLVAYEMERAAFDNERDREKIAVDREKAMVERERVDHEKWEIAQKRAVETERVWQTTVIRGGVQETLVFKRPIANPEQ